MNEYLSFFDFPLTNHQKEAFGKMRDFVNDEQGKVFILKGYAGTGKTTLMSGLLKWLQKEEKNYSLIASTGRASKILSDKTKNKARTIHSHIYSFDGLDENLDNLSLKEKDFAVDDKGQVLLLFDLKILQTEDNIIYIIDEASMISDHHGKSNSFAKFGSGQLLSDLFSFDRKGKFIFVGDPCQLPPVSQKNSPALSLEYIKEKFNFQVKIYELKEIMRQGLENGVMQSSLKLRTLYYSNPSGKFALFPLKGYKNILVLGSHANLINCYKERIVNLGFQHAAIICQTNRQCSELNSLIRSSLGKKSYSVEEGDLLLVTQNNYLSDLVNGDLVVVKNLGNKEYRCGITFISAIVQELVSEKIYSLLLVEDVLYSTVTNLNNKQHKSLMIDFNSRMKTQGISQSDESFKKNMLTDPYLNALRAVFGYAITCHKSQGGEWNEIFLYLDNKIHGIPKPEIYRWLYTAVTRAKENLYVADDWFIK